MRLRVKKLVAPIAIAWLALGPSLALAVPGDLDRSFSADGRTTVFFRHWSLTGVEADLARASDGGWIVATEVWHSTPFREDPGIAKLTPRGTPDRSFSSNGRLVLPTVGSDFEVHLATQGRRTLVTSDPLYGGIVTRLTAAGKLDDSFGEGGVARTPLPSLQAIEVLPGGKILVAGSAEKEGVQPPDLDFAVARLTAAGDPDLGFGSGGVTTIDFKSAEEQGREDRESLAAMAVGVDGRIVVSGTSEVIGDREHPHRDAVAVAALLPDGGLDPAFGSGGKVLLGPEAGGSVYGSAGGAAVEVRPDGGAVLAGVAGGDLAIAQLTAAGAPDRSFAGDGYALTDAGADTDHTDAVAISPQGQILLTGSTRGPTSTDVLVAGVSPYGALDPRFSSDGLVTVEFGGRYDDADAIELQPNGRIMVSATVGNGRVGVVRLLGR